MDSDIASGIGHNGGPPLDDPGPLAGIDTRKQLADRLGVDNRTICRYEKQGLPVIKRGRLRIYPHDTTNAWLRGELPRSEVRRGRPRKQ